MSAQPVYGIALEFDAPAALVEAARAVRAKGFRKVKAYLPYPIEELDEILPGSNPVPLMVLIGGILGGLTALAMEYYIAVIDYPINVGGRPLNSWPAFIPITFELHDPACFYRGVFGVALACRASAAASPGL